MICLSIAYVIGDGFYIGCQQVQVAISSGMDIRGPYSRSATSFNVSNGNPGEVKIVTEYMPRSVFHYQMTTTPADESTYKTIGTTTRSKMTINGLISGTRYYFRVCTIGKDGPEPWSNPVNLIVT